MAEGEKERIVAINPGSTSTKIGFFEGDRAVFEETISHCDGEMAPFLNRPVADQLDFRLERIGSVLNKKGIEPGRLSAAVGRGGLLKPLPSGTFSINEKMLADLREAKRGDHASNLGAPMAHRLAARAPGCRSFIVDPVSVDEWPPVARLSGMEGLDRECLSHALNTKAVAKRYAAGRGRRYEDLRLLVDHLGSGISVSAHAGGLMVDVTNSREEGAFSIERAGTVPVMKLLDLAFSGEEEKRELGARIFRGGGVCSYLGTRDLRDLLRRVASGEEKARLVFDGMIYQIAKEVGAMATVLEGKVDAVLLTGGMVHSTEVSAAIEKRVGWIAPVVLYPGEDELRALAEGALRVLRGEEEPATYS